MSQFSKFGFISSVNQDFWWRWAEKHMVKDAEKHRKNCIYEQHGLMTIEVDGPTGETKRNPCKEPKIGDVFEYKGEPFIVWCDDDGIGLTSIVGQNPSSLYSFITEPELPLKYLFTINISEERYLNMRMTSDVRKDLSDLLNHHLKEREKMSEANSRDAQLNPQVGDIFEIDGEPWITYYVKTTDKVTRLELVNRTGVNAFSGVLFHTKLTCKLLYAAEEVCRTLGMRIHECSNGAAQQLNQFLEIKESKTLKDIAYGGSFWANNGKYRRVFVDGMASEKNHSFVVEEPSGCVCQMSLETVVKPVTVGDNFASRKTS